MVGSILVLLAAYFVGAIPTGLLLGRWFGGVDLREHGSKNIGFTNAVRVLGWKVGVPVLVVDVGKAAAATAWLPALAGAGAPALLPVLAGIAVLVGNLFNVFLGFRGGKGVATAFGVFLVLTPVPVLFALGAFLAVLAVTRYVSAGAMTAAVVLAVATGVLHGLGATFGVTALAAVGVIVKHRANIARLMQGTENRIGGRKSAG
ncbi:MAG: glycerol-3-phosphate 1-O-acyltransferase PlsY [Candidatus Sumerlaeia bacterium]|nr:glycerol-3-phosphate 1-O-acyltransferase PlsY [Candidatus Sumerlaeia bacterium]